MIQNVYDPQSLNRYAFERNNPYKNTDPTGHYAWLYQLATAAIRWATNYIQNIHISIPRGKAVREAVTESYKELSEKYEEYKREKQVKEILAISDNAALRLEASTTEDKPKIGEFEPVTLEDLLGKEDKEIVDGKKIKKDDKLPDANELVDQIGNEEKSEHTGNSYNSGGSSGGGRGCVETCSISYSNVHDGGQVCFEVCNVC